MLRLMRQQTGMSLPIFRGPRNSEEERHFVPPKRRHTGKMLHGATSQNTTAIHVTNSLMHINQLFFLVPRIAVACSYCYYRHLSNVMILLKWQ
jgi:hypothetical protein